MTSVTTGPRWRASSFRGPSADRRRNASTEPAVQASQPASPSTRPGPSRWAPPESTVPRSEKKKPNVTMLVPSARRAPIRCLVPPETTSTALAAHTAR